MARSSHPHSADRRQPPVSHLQRRFDRIACARRLHGRPAKAVLNHLQRIGLFLVHSRVALPGEERLDFLCAEAFRDGHRKGQQQARVARGGGPLLDQAADAVDAVATHRVPAPPAVKHRRAREQELQMVIELGHRAHRRAGGAHRIGLVDGDCGRNALDGIDRGPVHPVEELARVGREGLHVAALSLGVQRIEHERGLARPAHARDDDQLVDRDIEVEILEVVLGAPRMRMASARDGSRGGMDLSVYGKPPGPRRGAETARRWNFTHYIPPNCQATPARRTYVLLWITRSAPV